jgi:hypothetical protein
MPGWLERASGLVRTAKTMLAVAVLAVASGCATTGSTFDSSALPMLVPGETTLEQASALLKSDPVNVYRQLDGSATARWAHKASLVTDAVYFNQELWLAFGPDGRYQRIVKSVNVPRANQFGDRY